MGNSELNKVPADIVCLPLTSIYFDSHRINGMGRRQASDLISNLLKISQDKNEYDLPTTLFELRDASSEALQFLLEALALKGIKVVNLIGMDQTSQFEIALLHDTLRTATQGIEGCQLRFRVNEQEVFPVMSKNLEGAADFISKWAVVPLVDDSPRPHSPAVTA